MIRRSRLLMLILPTLAVALLGLAVRSIARSNSADAPLPTAARPMPEQNLVAGSGLVEPSGRQVSVAAPTPGIVREVRVRPGDRVSAGDLLFAIDDAVATAAVEQRRRDLAAAESKLAQTVARMAQFRAERDATSAAILNAEAERDEARDQVDTAAQLVGGAVSQRELARRRNALRSAESRLAEAIARRNGADAALALLDPARDGATIRAEADVVEQARAALTLAVTERNRLFVRAPQEGTVLEVDIRPGEFANQGGDRPLVTLGRLDPLVVRVDVDEADIPRLGLGSSAVGARRGASTDRIPLRFLRAEPLLRPKRSLTGAPDERVDTRVLQLLYEVDGATIDLRPGQILDITITSAAGAPIAGR